MTTMEHNQMLSAELTILFSAISFIFKCASSIVSADTYFLLPFMHLVSIVAGICGIVSFLLVLHPPLKEKLSNLIKKK